MSQQVRKPFYIIDPLVLINQNNIAKSFLMNILPQFGSSEGKLRVLNQDLINCSAQTASKKTDKNPEGIFDYKIFMDAMKLTVPLISDEVIKKSINNAFLNPELIELDTDSIKSLCEHDNVTLFIGNGFPRSYIEHKIAECVKIYQNKGILEYNNFKIVRQTDKKERVEGLFDLAIKVKDSGFSPYIIDARATQLRQFQDEKKK